MGKVHYEFDRINMHFRRVGRSVTGVLKTLLRYVIVTGSLAIFYYVVFALFVSTDTERRLRRENKLYERTYTRMLEQENLIQKALATLEAKDDRIYEEIFHAEAPAVDPIGSMGFISASDTIPDRAIVEYTWDKVRSLEETSAGVDAAWERIFEFLQKKGGKALPPLSLPLEGISYAQVGASLGEKINPFYKVPVSHGGIDLIAPQGTAVLAAADGIVTDVVHSFKGHGNVVEITHSDGFITRYAHLADISVSKGQSVKRGRRLACVGISGNSFAPHLHYEILKDGIVLDPVNYFFVPVSPDEYANMLYMAGSTGQSLD